MNIKIIDLTRQLADGTEAYPGDHVGLTLKHVADAQSDGYNLSLFTHLEAHCGTHIDSPLHFVANGTDIASLTLKMPPAVVILAKDREIGPEVFADASNLSNHAVLIRTGWDQRIGSEEYYQGSPYLTAAAAQLLADSNITILGIDFPSPDPFESQNFPAHHILLGAGIPIVEGLVDLDQLDDTKRNQYFVAFPIKVSGIEGSPVRAAVIVLGSE